MTPFSNCANCYEVIYEGKRAILDELTDEYFCDKRCHEDWYADNYGNYFRKYCEVVDT